MPQNNIDLLPIGFRDRLYDEANVISRNIRAMTNILTSHGYKRTMPSMAEYETSLVNRMEGAKRNHLLRFTDPVSGRTLALRNDMTLQIGRIATTRLVAAPRPLRLCYHGTVTKLQSNPLNPDREMTQLGAELIGSDNVSASCEIVGLAIEALKSIGVTGITIDFTLPDLVETLSQKTFLLDADEVEQVREHLDMKDAASLKTLGALDYLPLLSATGEFETALKKLCDIDAGGALSTRIDGLRSIASYVADDVNITLDPTERHGFEYQNWFGFTLFADNIPGAIGRGGTYNLSNGEKATGFSLFPESLHNVSNIVEEKYIFLPLNHDQTMAAELRKEGWVTIAALDEYDVGQTLGCSHFLDGDNIECYSD